MLRPACLALILCLSTSPIDAATETSGAIRIGEILPETSMQGLNGPSKSLSEYRGRPLIINVWASWCSPCRSEMASLERLAWLNQTGDFNVIGVSTDDYPDRARALLVASNATITHFIDSGLRIETMLGASRLPLTVLVGADGRILRKVYGAREWDSPRALALIENAFADRPSDSPGSNMQRD